MLQFVTGDHSLKTEQSLSEDVLSQWKCSKILCYTGICLVDNRSFFEFTTQVAGGEDWGQCEKKCQYLYCSGFKIVELITEGPDSDSVLVVEQKGHEEEARMYLASQRLNHPQNTAQFLESLPGGLYRPGHSVPPIR